MLDNKNLLFLVVGSTICLILCQWYKYILLPIPLKLLFFSSDVNECLKIECLNNATCVNRDGSYQCDCLPGYTGQFCEIGM